MKMLHKIGCSFPEGCSCGAGNWNRREDQMNILKSKLAAALHVLEELKKEHDAYSLESHGMIGVDPWGSDSDLHEIAESLLKQ